MWACERVVFVNVGRNNSETFSPSRGSAFCVFAVIYMFFCCFVYSSRCYLYVFFLLYYGFYAMCMLFQCFPRPSNAVVFSEKPNAFCMLFSPFREKGSKRIKIQLVV